MTDKKPVQISPDAIRSPYLDQLRNGHQYQGRSNDCGPYCTAAVIHTVKRKKVSGVELGQRMAGVKWKGILPKIYRIRNWATFPWGIRNMLKDEHIPARWSVFQKVETLQSLLSQNVMLIVIVGRFFPSWAHYKILTAYDPNRGYGFIDSAYKTSEVHWDKAELFEKYWKNYGSQIISIYPDGLPEKKTRSDSQVEQ